MCRRRSAITPNAPGVAVRLILGSPAPQSPAIAVDEPPVRAPALVLPLQEAALVQYSPLYCAVFNYAALHPATRGLALEAAREAAAAHFAPRHMDQIRNLLIDARRLFQRWGGEVQQALEHWREEVDADGYAGADEQMAVRDATEAAGGLEAQEFWLGFDLLGPEVLQGFQRQAAVRRTRGVRGGGGAGTGM